MASKRPPDKRTRSPGVVARHSLDCPANRDGRCRCEPGYVARVWDPERRRPVSSPTYRNPLDGVSWQQETRASFASSTQGRRPTPPGCVPSASPIGPGTAPHVPISLAELASLLADQLAVVQTPVASAPLLAPPS